MQFIPYLFIKHLQSDWLRKGGDAVGMGVMEWPKMRSRDEKEDVCVHSSCAGHEKTEQSVPYSVARKPKLGQSPHNSACVYVCSPIMRPS